MELHYDEDYAHIDELHKRDALINMLRDIEGESKLGMIKLMAQTKHNSRYNHNLLPTYLTIRERYDKYIKEQQVTIEHLEKIITHLDNILIDFMKKRGHNGKGNNKMNKDSCSKYVDNFIANILKEKQKVSKMLIKMRNVLNKLAAIDSHVDVTPALLNSLTVSDIEQVDDDEDEYVDNDNDDDGLGDDDDNDEGGGDDVEEDDGSDDLEEEGDDGEVDEHGDNDADNEKKGNDDISLLFRRLQ